MWSLVLFAFLLWLVAFPALVGLLAGLGLWSGQRLEAALAALAVALVVVTGSALREPWRRPSAPTLDDPRPLFVRFSTWLITALLLPHVLFGVVVLSRPAPAIGYGEAAMIGLLLSILHAGGALLERWRSARRAAGGGGGV